MLQNVLQNSTSMLLVLANQQLQHRPTLQMGAISTAMCTTCSGGSSTTAGRQQVGNGVAQAAGILQLELPAGEQQPGLTDVSSKGRNALPCKPGQHSQQVSPEPSMGRW